MNMRVSLLIFFSLTVFCLRAQTVPPVVQELPEVRVDPNFELKYQQAYSKIKRVYPLALQAKGFLVEFEREHQEIEKRRKQKQFERKSYKILKDEFVYDIRDLYISQGIMLMKLVHRETGLTVAEILTKYQSQLKTAMYEGIGKLFEQDLSVEYDPYGDDWITELVIQDIIAKRIPFNWELKPLNKAEFKDTQKTYKERKKEAKKEQRKYKKVKRQTKRAGAESE